MNVFSVFFGFYCIAWTIQCFSYTTEILPYNLRTKGLAIFVSLQNAALAFNNYVNPYAPFLPSSLLMSTSYDSRSHYPTSIALEAIQWRFYLVYIGTASVWLVIIYFTFPEIKNLTIEEISTIFEHGWKGQPTVLADSAQDRKQDAREASDSPAESVREKS